MGGNGSEVMSPGCPLFKLVHNFKAPREVYLLSYKSKTRYGGNGSEVMSPGCPPFKLVHNL